MKKVMLGMSGGVDSSAAAVLLKNAGYEVAGVTLRLFGETMNADILDAKKVCSALDMEHFVLDVRKEFSDSVINNFCESYAAGLTPNPCVVCNKKIKFGKMLDFALSKGYDFVATGHYAKVESENGRYLVKKADDLSKDQSYVLYSLNQQQLSHILLPLGTVTKEYARRLAEDSRLVTAHKSDSQDICFVPDGDYAEIIEKTLGRAFDKGDYVDVNGKILGRHNGIIHYTVGQRKGLGIALGKPQFVIKKEVLTNTVTLGDEEYLFSDTVTVKDINLIDRESIDGETQATVKLRYSHKEQPAVLKPNSDGSVTVIFDTPQRAATPGQSAVFYIGDTVIGGGKILSEARS